MQVCEADRLCFCCCMFMFVLVVVAIYARFVSKTRDESISTLAGKRHSIGGRCLAPSVTHPSASLVPSFVLRMCSEYCTTSSCFHMRRHQSIHRNIRIIVVSLFYPVRQYDLKPTSFVSICILVSSRKSITRRKACEYSHQTPIPFP